LSGAQWREDGSSALHRAEEINMNSQPPKVLIVGAGPTGMTAALELSRLQIPVRIIEKMAEPATTSRAVGVQARTLELLEQRGLVEQMLAKGNRGLAGSIYDGGKRVFRLEFSHNGSQYGYLLFISQAETEAILRAALEKQRVTIEREVEFVALSQSENGDSVKAILKHRGGSLEEVNCEYLIDSEGAHSISRTTLNLQFEGKTRKENYALGDLYIDGDLPGSDFHIFSSEFGFMGMFPMGERRFRLIASNPLSKPNKDTAPSIEELQQIYDQRSHVPARFHGMSWSSWFRINSRMVGRLHVGRVFLGGDSAHIHSPAGAQGMNTGIQDMINLAWKLAFVIKRQADPKLLDTYSDERIPVIRSVLTKTERLTDVIGSENPVFRSGFSHIAPWIVGTEFVQENSTERMSQLSLNYRDSPLSASYHSLRSLRAGDRVPNLDVQVVGGRGEAMREPTAARLFQLLNTDRFTLLFANLNNGEATHHFVQSSFSPWKELLETYSIAPSANAEQTFKSIFGSKPAVILVRPDGYAAFTGSVDSLDPLAKYLKSWFPVQKETENENANA
jgi:2-polyprenyl-6-methoxyphenol hydroxylase-like FAD-dependent oxidoreductase